MICWVIHRGTDGSSFELKVQKSAHCTNGRESQKVVIDVITPENGPRGMSLPLHIGAYKYYTEVGIEVPEDLIRPEAK